MNYPMKVTRFIYCPHCGADTGAKLVYCTECGHSWLHGHGVTFCTHPPEHDGDRRLICSGCGYQADREGVITPDGNLIPYPDSVIAQLINK
jgi:hypothetical protein